MEVYDSQPGIVKRIVYYRCVGVVVFALFAVWWGGDFGYSRYIARRYRKSEAHTQRYADGVRKGCRAFDIGKGDTALLFVHGFADSPAMFRHMAETLADEEFECRGMRLPGFAVPIEQASVVGREAWRDALAFELEDLRRTHDAVYIVGHSLGATVAMAQLMEDPSAADGAILLCPMLEVSDRRSPLLSPKQWFHVGSALTHFTTVVESRFPLDVTSAVVTNTPGRDSFVTVHTLSELFSLMASVTKSPQDFESPALVIVAGQDRVVDPHATVRFFEQSKAHPQEVLMLKEEGHMVPLGRQADPMCTRIKGFIRSLG